MSLNWEKARQLVDRHRIIYGLTGALIIAGLLTTISMALYVSSGASRLDLSRPGYESARGGIDNDPARTPFSANGPMNNDVANDFQDRFNTYRDRLDKLDDFSTSALDDTELQIAPKTNE